MQRELRVEKMSFRGFIFQIETRGNFSTVSAANQHGIVTELEHFKFTFLRDFLDQFESEFRVKILECQEYPAQPSDQHLPLLLWINHQSITATR